MRQIIILVLLVFSILEINALNLEEARQIALQNNPDLLAAEAADKAGKASLWKSYLTIAPTATINGSYTYFDETQSSQNLPEDYDSSIRYQLLVNQPLFNGGKVWLGAAISRYAEKTSEQSYKSMRLSTIVNLETKYFAVLKNQTLLQIARKSLQSSQTNSEIAKIKFEAGSLAKAGYLQLLAEQANKEVNLIQMEHLYQISLLDLANFLQLENMENMQDIEKEAFHSELENLQQADLAEIENMVAEIMQIGMAENPSLKISEYSVKTSEKALWMAGGNFLPSLNLQYSKSWSKYDFEDELNDNSGQLGLNISLPIFPLADNALEVASSRQKFKQAKYKHDSAKKSIELMIRSSFLSMISAAKMVSSSILSLDYARETFEQMQERFANGAVTANELLSAEIMYTSAQNQMAASFYGYLTAKSTLLQQLGCEDKEILNKIIMN